MGDRYYSNYKISFYVFISLFCGIDTGYKKRNPLNFRFVYKAIEGVQLD